MKTIIATAGAITDASTKLTPGRYALAFKAATTAPNVLDQGTLNIALRLDQKAKITTANAITATNFAINITTDGEPWTASAITPGAAGNTIGIQTIADDTQPTAWLRQDLDPGWLFTLRYNPLDRILFISTKLEDDGTDEYEGGKNLTFTPGPQINGFPSWIDEIGKMSIRVVEFPILEQGKKQGRWEMINIETNNFPYIYFTDADPYASLPNKPPLDDPQSWLPTDATVEGAEFDPVGIVSSEILALFEADPANTAILLLDPDADDPSNPVAALPRTFLADGADPVIALETIDIPLLTSIEPGAAPLTYDLSEAAERRAHLEFIVTEPSSLLLTLTGGNTTGALHLSCNPINP